MNKNHTITAALPYANGPIHIGHLAGVYIPADIYARYLRMKGKNVLFICGSDEHGVPISIKATKEGISPQQVVDKYHRINKKAFNAFGISFDHYSRTSSRIHHETASNFFLTLYRQGDFEEKTTEQLYDQEAQQFLADRFVLGTCPKCGNEESYGDQCENCGTSHNATDLINPRSAISGNIPILKKTKHWFLPLDRYQEFLSSWILEKHKKDWKPNVYGQCKSWLDEGLRARAVTRDLDWGIPVPLRGESEKVLYVWFDAPIGYISATKQWAKSNAVKWKDYWDEKKTELVHFIGKDNIVFHCIIFPAMLKAHGGFALPENVPANEFLNLESKKLSTSKNWAVWLHEYLEDFKDKQDVLRYVLTAIAPERKDSDFTWSDFQARANNELVAIYGNFINRVVVLTHKYFDGIVPPQNKLLEQDCQLFISVKKLIEKTDKSIQTFYFRDALACFMKIARLGNKYLADQEPWKKIKESPQRAQTILNVSVQIATVLSIVGEPFLPFTSLKLRKLLNFTDLPRWIDDLDGIKNTLPEGHLIEPPALLFEKIDNQQIQIQLNRLGKNRKMNENQKGFNKPKNQKENIAFDAFSKLDIRTATILEAKRVPKTDKLIQLTVETGLDKRTIVSGIAQHFETGDLIGQKVSVVLNLEPRKLRGVLSEGMILMAETPEGKLSFVRSQESENGEEIR